MSAPTAFVPPEHPLSLQPVDRTTPAISGDVSPKLTKWVAAHGIASRREAEKMIIAGRIVVDGEICYDVTRRINPNTTRIAVDGKKLAGKAPAPELYIFYKPRGCVTSVADEKGRPTIYDSLPKHMRRFRYVGRLDYNSEGLLLLTNDGAALRALTLPQNAFERLYRVRCFGYTEEVKLSRLAKGCVINNIKYRPARFTKEESGQACQSWYRVALSEGKNREIRVMCEYAGLQVTRLIRIKYGPYELGAMAPGEFKKVDFSAAFPDGPPDADALPRKQAYAQKGGRDMPASHVPNERERQKRHGGALPSRPSTRANRPYKSKTHTKDGVYSYGEKRRDEKYSRGRAETLTNGERSGGNVCSADVPQRKIVKGKVNNNFGKRPLRHSEQKHRDFARPDSHKFETPRKYVKKDPR